MEPMSVLSDGVAYPESDGLPMAENEVQGAEIIRLVNALQLVFRHRPDVHVGFDLLWYPVKGHPEICRAPDVFVVPGRPQDPKRPNWLQWEEDGVAMRHVVEILSPTNRPAEMAAKRQWYARYGVDEYVVFDPDSGVIEIHVRTDLGLSSIDVDLPWASGLLEGHGYDVRASGAGDGRFELFLVDPDGVAVPTIDDLADRAAAESARAAAESARADALAARLRELGIDDA